MVIIVHNDMDNKILIDIKTDLDDMIGDIKALTDKNFKLGSNSDGFEVSVRGTMTMNTKEGKLTFLFEPA